MTDKPSALRIILGFLTLLPALVFAGFLTAATPDFETWLKYQTQGLARSDAFDGVSRVSPLFSVLLGITSLLAGFLVVSRRSQYLLSLAVGPLLTAVVYVVDNGFSDPSWFSLLALLAIGMFVSSSVTAMWVVINNKHHRSHAAER